MHSEHSRSNSVRPTNKSTRAMYGYRILILLVALALIVNITNIMGLDTQTLIRNIQVTHKDDKNRTMNLLIIMVDNRFNFNNVSMDTLDSNEYYHHTAIINLLYATKWNYSLILVKPITNCNMRYINTTAPPPFNAWCKTEFISYYLNEYASTSFNWILYLDSDAAITQYQLSFKQMLQRIRMNYLISLKEIDIIIGQENYNGAHKVIRYLCQTYEKCQCNLCNVTNENVTTVNTGVIFIKNNDNAYLLIESWAKSIEIESEWKYKWGYEQSSFNCFINYHPNYKSNILRLKAQNEIHMSNYINNTALFVHITSLFSVRRKTEFSKYVRSLNTSLLWTQLIQDNSNVEQKIFGKIVFIEKKMNL
eukprot:164837_1